MMELGPIQKEWVKYLRAHPEQQVDSRLGYKQPDGRLRMCCLGAALKVFETLDGTPLQFTPDQLGADFVEMLTDGYKDVECFYKATEVLDNSYKKLGLFSASGSFHNSTGLLSEVIPANHSRSLSEANDYGVTWPQIADFIESNPEIVFKESV